MKIILVDDHPLIQDGIKLILERHYSSVTLVSAYDYAQAMKIFETNTDFDLVIYDLGLPDIQSFEGLSQIHSILKNIPIIVLSGSESPMDMRLAMAAGAKGYVQKSASNDVIASAIQCVLSGIEYVPNAASDSVSPAGAVNIKQYHKASRNNGKEDSAQSSLSKRQIEVLQLVIMGKTNKEIGRTLSISDATARTHVTAIFKALKVCNRTEACYAAVQRGLWPRDTGRYSPAKGDCSKIG
jgi:two-component system, NarL family, nitrate/nitrite response regulator NarL